VSLPRVAVVGRANVGKSTLVNRILGRREAIEHPAPGVTRDRRVYDTNWSGVHFQIVDTGGYEPRGEGLNAKVRAQAQRAAGDADLILFVVDAETGVTEDDLVVARELQRGKVPVVVVGNKIDDALRELDLHELHALGLGDPVGVSALHGRGSGDLLDQVVAAIRELPRIPERIESRRVAIVGRPNVGKSSLFNKLVGEERSVVHDMPGTTRDPIDTLITREDRSYTFIDTAGWRRHAEHRGPEYFALARLYDAVDLAEIVVHVIDADEGTTDQDQRIAAKVVEAGRACILVLNKWDLIDTEEPEEPVEHLRDQLRFIPWASLVRTSALTGRGIHRVWDAIDAAYEAWTTRVPTGELNAWLRDGLEGVPLGTTSRGTPVRIRYGTQARTSPPTFVFSSNGIATTSGIRGIENRLRARFGFDGTPIRVVVKRRTREG
jgi:GTP-binding protein